MDPKYSIKIQKEINELLNQIKLWEKFFKITTKYFFDGWAIYLREMVIYPRLIIIFKPYSDKNYSISSFEIHYTEDNEEIYKMLYSNNEIQSISNLVIDFKKILYGKDIANSLLNLKSSLFEQ